MSDFQINHKKKKESLSESTIKENSRGRELLKPKSKEKEIIEPKLVEEKMFDLNDEKKSTISNSDSVDQLFSSNNIVYLGEHRMKKENNRLSNPTASKFSQNGGNGGDNMEQRLSKLEKVTEEIRNDINSINTEVKCITINVNESLKRTDFLIDSQKFLNKDEAYRIEDNIKNSIDALGNKLDTLENKFATKEDIEKSISLGINKAKLTAIKYIIGTGIAIVAAIAAVLKLFF